MPVSAFSGSSAPPLTIRTGTDDNGDLVFNDRPAGVGRNSERTTSTWNTSASFGYSFTLGKKTVTSGGGVQIMGSPAGLTVNPTATQTTPRYRLNLSVNINNLWNQASYSGFSSIITSPNFLKPSSRLRMAPDHVCDERELLIASRFIELRDRRSLRAQRHHRIDARRPARWQIAGDRAPRASAPPPSRGTSPDPAA